MKSSLQSCYRALLTAAFISIGLSSLQAQTSYYLTASQTDPRQWNTVSHAQGWHTLVDDTYVQATAMDATGYYYSNGFNLRTPSGATPFGGARLTLDATLLMRNSQSISHLQAVDGATFTVGVNGVMSLTANLFEQSGTTTYATTVSSRGHGLIYSTLTGNGTMAFNGFEKATSFVFNITDASAYAGTFQFNQGTFSFQQDLSSAASLAITANSVVNLTHGITTRSLTIGTDTLGAGTYSYSWLNSNYEGIFTAGSVENGFITVIPEPSTYSLLAGGVALLALTRRRRQVS